MSPASERAVILGLNLAWVQNDRDVSLRWFRGTTCLFRQFDLIIGDSRRFGRLVSLFESISFGNVVRRRSLAPCWPSSQGLLCELLQHLVNAIGLK